MTARAGRCRGLVATVLLVAALASAQTPDELQYAVDRLGDFDYDTRQQASRLLRRAETDTVVPLLLDAARGHVDSYVQFRAIVLLHGFDLPQARDIFAEALGSRNDRVRAAAYEYFEQFPSPAVVSRLLAAMETETSEFVRPYLVRALAAHDDAPDVQEELVLDIDRGQGYFRGAVIEALGDYGATYAVGPLIRIASEDGPIRDDAILALGKIGDPRAEEPLGRIQRDADATLQPMVSAAACLLGIDCEAQFAYIAGALEYAAADTSGDQQPLLRSAAAALAGMAVAGRDEALDPLFDVGADALESVRAPVAIALGTVAFRRPVLVRDVLHRRGETAPPEAELLLLRDAFDLLDEDFAEERFYVLMRGDYWGASTGSADQALAEAAIRVLEF